MLKLNLFHKTVYFFLGVVLLFLVTGVPLIDNVALANSTIISKTIFFTRGLTLTFLFWLAYILFVKKPMVKLKVSKIDIVLLLLVSYLMINRYFIQSNYGFSIRFIDLIALSFFYVFIRAISIKICLWLLLAVVFSGIIQAIYGNLQLLEHYPSNHAGFKMTGSFFNPGPYAGFLVTVWSLALSFYLFKNSIIKQVLVLEIRFSSILNVMIKYAFEYIPLLGIISIVLVLPATRSRASWLAFIISSIILLELRYHFLKKVLHKITALKKGIFVIGTLIIISFSLFGIYQLKKGSSDGRIFIWKVSTEIIKEFPAFGVGFDRFKAHYMNNQTNYFTKYGETKEALVADNTYYAFNEFIQFITENGILGFILLIAILFIVYKTPIVRDNEKLGIAAKTGLITISVFASFSYPMEILPIKLVMVSLLAIIAILDCNKVILFKNNKVNFQASIFKILVLGTSLITIIVSVIYINKVNASFKTWKYALNSYQYGDYESAIENYEDAYLVLKKNGDFLMNYGKALSMNKKNDKAVQILEEAKQHLNTTIIETALGDTYKNLKQYNKAEIAYKNAANMIPTRFYPLYLLAKLYEESGEKAKAKTIAKNILNKEVKIPSTAIKEIKTEMKKILVKKND